LYGKPSREERRPRRYPKAERLPGAGFERGFKGMNKVLEHLFVKAGVRLAEKSSRFRGKIRELVTDSLKESYESLADDQNALDFQRVFGISMWPFLENIFMNKPRAAENVIHFVLQWSHDMEKRALFRRMGLITPDTYVVEPTNACNLKCPGCYALSERSGSELPYEVLEQIDDEMKEIGVTLTTISGGEPFMAEVKNRAISRLAEHNKRKNDSGFLVYTNGTLIDEKIARRLGNLGNIWPAISLEGFAESTMRRRGRRIIEQTKRAKDHLNKNGVMYGFSATATRFNAEEIASDRFFAERMAEGDNFGWIFLYQPIGRGVDADLMVTGEQRYKIGKKVMEMQIENRIPLFLGDFWNYGPFVEGCIAAGRCYFHIMADGIISPCVFSPFGVAHLSEIESFGRFPEFNGGGKRFKNIQDALTNQETMISYRDQQNKIKDRFRPCVLIDHPDYAREIFSRSHCFETNNTPADYFRGKTADIIDQRAREWQEVWSLRLKEYAEGLVVKNSKRPALPKGRIPLNNPIGMGSDLS
jgi:MoaA/NifB/PqqE/SkfB family radical SAM enzyme